MLTVSESGLYCAAGDFHIDPWRPVERAVVTHAHADHARAGCGSYVCAEEGVGVMRVRLGGQASVMGQAYGRRFRVGEVEVSFHPAGHVLGSAQVRLERRGEVWVVSGDYKLGEDPTCAAFEPVRCDTFVTESTFGLPIYRWPRASEVFEEIHGWWRGNQESGRRSVLLGYSLGKAQRLLAGLDATVGPIGVHPSVAELLPAYRSAGVVLPEVKVVRREEWGGLDRRSLVVMPPGAGLGGEWVEAGEVSVGTASGWNQVRRTRNRVGVDRGFVLSDHADWPGLMGAIRATGASRVWVTHGVAVPLVRYLKEGGWEAEVLGVRPRDGGEA